ncbi:MAG: hypothetical protein ACQEQZ_08480 [Pseudomonadota bacterium]
MMAVLAQKWQQGCEWFSEQAKARRLLIAVAIWLLVSLPLLSYGVLPNLQAKLSGEQEIQAAQQQIEQIQVTIEQLQQQLTISVDKPVLQKIERKSRRLATLKEKTDRFTLLDKAQRQQFLQDSLSYADGIDLLQLESRSPEQVSEQKSASLYRHQVSAVYQGNFTELMLFFKQLRKQHPEVQWFTFDYQVIDYPRAEARIVWQLLSTDKEIIGG